MFSDNYETLHGRHTVASFIGLLDSIESQAQDSVLKVCFVVFVVLWVLWVIVGFFVVFCGFLWFWFHHTHTLSF